MMRKLATVGLFLAVAWVMNIATALAAPSPDELFKKWDVNSDGKVTLDEMVKATGGKEEKVKEYFTKMDKNSDGSIDLEELRAFIKK
jgi:Ca2+-binding EF-hand superfamily protein